MDPRQRYYYEALLDHIFTWQHSLPPQKCTYKISTHLIPVPNHSDTPNKPETINLAATLYQPSTPPLTTILVRTPYGISLPSSLAIARMYASRGYQVLTNSCRGTFASEGHLEAGRHESADGKAVVTWMRAQSWYTGTFATLGGSFLGYTQWALLDDPPSDVCAAVINSGPHDFGWLVWNNGALKQDIIPWTDLTSRMRRGDGYLSIMFFVMSMAKKLQVVYDAVPLLSAVRKYLGDRMPEWLERALSTPDHDDEF